MTEQIFSPDNDEQPSANALLITVEKSDAMQVFTDQARIEAIIKQIEQQVTTLVPDVSTAKGRSEIKSLAHKVTRSKTYLDDIGKELVADLKELPKRIDASRKAMRERLDALRDTIRQPLDAWEAEQAAIAAQRKAEAEAIERRKQAIGEQITSYVTAPLNLIGKPASDIEARLNELEANAPKAEDLDDRYQEAVTAYEGAVANLRVMLDQQKVVEAREREQRDREVAERAAQEAADREQAKAQQQIIDARIAEENAKKAVEDANKRAADAEARIERERQQAAEEERKRLEDEQRRQKEEADKRAADLEHRKRINRDVLADMINVAGLPEDKAKDVIRAIAAGKISRTTINY